MKKTINFAQNLACYRLKQGITQSELADKLGFSVKSVSKWETGRGLPTLETIVGICEILKVSIEELLFDNNGDHYYLGIDGGGTKTDFILADQNGNILNRIVKEGVNPNDIGIEQSTGILKEGINEICVGIPYSKVSVYAGIAGGGIEKQKKRISEMLSKLGFAYVNNGSDTENICALAEGAEKLVVIMGTGFVIIAVSEEKMTRLAGWGQLFDEGGSGYNLGRDAIYAALKEHDGTGEKTVLSELIEQRIGDSASNALTAFYEGGKRYIASFADVVFDAADKNDKTAVDIIEKNTEFVANNIKAAVKNLKNQDDVKVYFAGGMTSYSNVLFPYIEKHLNNKNIRLIKITKDPVFGALMLAGKEHEDAKN